MILYQPFITVPILEAFQTPKKTNIFVFYLLFIQHNESKRNFRSRDTPTRNNLINIIVLHQKNDRSLIFLVERNVLTHI